MTPPPPDFTHEELWVINYFKSRGGNYWRDMAWNELAYILPACLVLGLGIYLESRLHLIVGFLILLFFKLREMFLAARVIRLYRNILRKYESCWESQTDQPHHNSVPNSR